MSTGLLRDKPLCRSTLTTAEAQFSSGPQEKRYFDGKLNGIVDEASIYNRALAATEIAALYSAGAGSGEVRLCDGLLTTLATFVQTLNLSNGISNSLDAKLQNALRALHFVNAGDSPSACNRMGAFINEVKAQAGKALTAGKATQLTSWRVRCDRIGLSVRRSTTGRVTAPS